MVVGPGGELPLPWFGRSLHDALERARGHGLVLHGAVGDGVFEFAMALAQGWLCEGDAARPCGDCTACRLTQSRSHPDLAVLVPEAARAELGWATDADSVEGETSGGARERRKPSRQIRIDEVRAARDWVVKTASRGRGKVLVLHPATQLNAQAASALLKMLEEPPAGVRLLLSAEDPTRLLPTVLSRCQRITAPAPPRAVALDWLTGQAVPDAAVLLDAAGARPLDALRLARQGIGAAFWNTLPRALAAADAAVFAGWSVPAVVDALLRVAHDAMLRCLGAPPRFLTAAQWPEAADLARLAAWQRELLRVARHDQHPWNEALLIEALALQGRAALSVQPHQAPRGLDPRR